MMMPCCRNPSSITMADLDDFFAKKDKKKRGGKKGFSKANTDVLAKNLEEKELRDLKAEEKASPLATSEATKLAFEDNPVAGVHGPGGQVTNGARVRECEIGSNPRSIYLLFFTH